MDSVLPVPAAATLHRIRQIQAITIAWMSAEAVVSLSAAWMAHSPALLAFGGDSAIELLSAVVVYRRFSSELQETSETSEHLAARITGGLLFALAAYVALIATLALLGRREARPSILGVVVLIIAAVAMPLLAQQKRRLSALTTSAALRADAAESALCGYLSIIAPDHADCRSGEREMQWRSRVDECRDSGGNPSVLRRDRRKRKVRTDRRPTR